MVLESSYVAEFRTWDVDVPAAHRRVEVREGGLRLPAEAAALRAQVEQAAETGQFWNL